MSIAERHKQYFSVRLDPVNRPQISLINLTGVGAFAVSDFIIYFRVGCRLRSVRKGGREKVVILEIDCVLFKSILLITRRIPLEKVDLAGIETEEYRLSFLRINVLSI